jgi:hypothetical protein
MAWQRAIRFFLVAGIILGLAACAASGGGTRPSKATKVEDRAVERWQFLIQKKAENAYDYLTPGVRSTKSRTDYAQMMNNRPISWVGIRYLEKQCESEDVCTLKLLLTYNAPMPVSTKAGTVQGNSHLEERWLQVDGAWYHLPDAYRQ